MDNRALLDELMGVDRDLPLDRQKKKKLRYDDPEVCHYHLAAFCPHDLFPNTKSDLGPCGKTHDDGLREEYLKSNKVAVYESELLQYLDRLIADLERKIKRCHERLDKELPLTDQAKANSDRISGIAMEVQALLKQAENEGEEGQVDLAQATMAKVDALNKEKEALVRAVVPEFAVSSVLEKEKRMQVCEVCGAMQASTDTEKRLASHLEGKQHLGYYRIRQMVAELRKKREAEREARRKDAAANGTTLDSNDEKAVTEAEIASDTAPRERNGRGERERELRRDRSRSHEKDRPGWDNDRDRDRHRDRDRDRDKDRHRDRDRDRERDRDRDRDRERDRDRDRHRDRERDWDRDRDIRKDRDRDRDKEGSSRRRERDREKR